MVDMKINTRFGNIGFLLLFQLPNIKRRSSEIQVAIEVETNIFRSQKEICQPFLSLKVSGNIEKNNQIYVPKYSSVHKISLLNYYQTDAPYLIVCHQMHSKDIICCLLNTRECVCRLLLLAPRHSQLTC